jgi:ribose transport system substrate-binding protein
MSTRKWALLLLGVVACIAVALYYRSRMSADAPAPLETTRIALFAAHADQFWDIVIAGARRAAKENHAALEVMIPVEEEGVDSQTRALIQLDRKKFDGIAISPRSPIEQSRLISEMAADLFVVTVDNDAPQSVRHCYVGTNNLSAGKMAVELIERALPNGGKIALFVGDNERQNARDRREAIISLLSGVEDDPRAVDGALDQPIDAGKYTLVGTYLDGGSPKMAVSNVKQALQDHPDLACLVALYDYNGTACHDALAEVGKLGKVKIVAFDENETTLKGIENGEIVGTVVQDPFRYGYESVRLLAQMNNDKTLLSVPVRASGAILISCAIVDRDNLDEFRHQLKSRLASVK